MGGKRIELKVSEELNNSLEKYKKENSFEDKQDVIREILRKELYKKSLIDKIKSFFYNK